MTILSRAVFALLCCTAIPAARVREDPPNVVIIVADDLGWADVSMHGSPIKTPNIDRLAKEGADLTRFYVCPVCSPTRAGLMTGRYPIRFGLMRAVVPPWRKGGLDTTEVTLPQVLKKAGYNIAAFLESGTLGIHILDTIRCGVVSPSSSVTTMERSTTLPISAKANLTGTVDTIRTIKRGTRRT